MRIPDLIKARPEQIDLELIERKLWRIRRFQGHPDALNVRPHTFLVQQLAIRDDAENEVIRWSYHHDDHEALTGDAHGLLLRVVSQETTVWDDVTDHLDRTICEARRMEYPSRSVREATHFYDKLAESLESRFGLGWPPLENHPKWPIWLDDDYGQSLFEWAQSLREQDGGGSAIA